MVARRGAVLAVVLMVGAVSAALALRVDADFTPEELFTYDGEQKRATESFRASFGNTDNVLVVLVEADDVLQPAPLTYVRDLSAYLAAQPYTAHVTSITRTPLPLRTGTARPIDAPISTTAMLSDLAAGRLRADAAIEGDGPIDATAAADLSARLGQTPSVWGQLVSRDRRVAVVAVLIDGARDRVEELETVVADVEAYLAAHAAAGLRTHLGGLPYIRVDVVRSVEADQTVLFPAAFAVIFILLFATFRWAPAVGLPLIAVGLSAAALMGGMGAVGEPLNIINNVVPILVIIIGISDSIHLVNRYGEELVSSGGNRRVAARRSLRTMMVALFLTSFTTAVGFASLAVSHLPILGRFGVTAAFGVLAAYAITVLLLPGALSLMPAPRRPLADTRNGWVEGLIGRLFEAVARRRWPVLAGSGALLAGAIVLARGVPVDTAVHHQYDQGSAMWSSIQLLEHQLDGLRPVEVGLTAAPDRFRDPEVVAAVDRVTRWARAESGVLSAHGYADLLRQAWFVATGNDDARTADFGDRGRLDALGALLDRAPDQLERYVTRDRSRARISLRMADIGGVATIAFVDRLRAELGRELPADVEVAITGEGYTASAGLTTLTRDLLVSLLLAVVVIFGFMTLVLRSLRLGLISVPPNLLPLVATIAYLRLRGIPLSPATVIIFSISIGLAVDGTIHVLARFREEIAAGADRTLALTRAGRGTGKAVVVSYVSLIIGFIVFRWSTFVPVQQFGELISVTVAGCLVSTLVVLPALLSACWPDRS